MLVNLAVCLYQLIETHTTLSFLICGISLIAYYLVLYPFYLSPLRFVPGPYVFRISKLPSLHYQRSNQWVLFVHELHKIYGDVVILSPQEVSVNGDVKYLNDIYVKNFPKSTFYENFRNHGHKDNIFASLENDRHLKYKKNITNIYSKSAIFNSKNSTRATLVNKISKLIGNIKTSSVDATTPDYINAASEINIHGHGHHFEDKQWFKKGKTKNLGIEVYSLFGSLALDVVSSFELGAENGTDLLDNPEKREIVIYHRYVASMVFYTTLMPKLWNFAATSLILKSAEIVESWQLNLYRHAETNVPIFKSNENITTLELLKKNGLHGEYAYSFLSDNIFAGHETTAIQLSYIVYELSRSKNQYLQSLLKKELDQAFGKPVDSSAIISEFEQVDKLPVLNAILLENSRVHTSIPGAEPRVVNKDNYKISDIKIPKHTIISAQPYSMHRVEAIFPNPDYFIVERWLPKDTETEFEFENRFKLQNKYMMPFGKGIRMCLGMHIAQIEMKLAIANIYWHFTSQICSNWCKIVEYGANTKFPNPIKIGSINVGANETDEEKMTMFDTYTTRPYNDECWIEFFNNSTNDSYI